ncbi:phosphatidylinositol-specific phospholipase C-like protein 4 [Elsinoe australis]|uniref:Phosphoinositide phospholipase C n=1 Tax=Elsinoe australis TaxID=40998 RepID=A0A4U7ATV5_9PEZI|nr:phosphatidylinositol-specific phospholipase C-like protein 4 [Elsinoe australis]
MAETLTARMTALNPFNKTNRKASDEDVGEQINADTVAGGGHGNETKADLRVNVALQSFLADQGAIPEAGKDGGSTPAVQQLLDKPHVVVPASLTDRSHPLPEYFISSSHNTYLMAHQLYGSSNASAYELALNTGSRCVEIDAWDNDDIEDEPKVTHGYTLVSNIPFRSVCETIRNVVDKEAAEEVDAQGYRAAPIVLSLENHCGPHGQLRLANIMTEVFGDRLLSKAVREEDTAEQNGGSHVALGELGSKVVVIVEYHFPNEKDDSGSSSDSESEDEAGKRERQKYKEKKQAAPAVGIIPELAALGVYAQSVKPRDNSWFEQIEGLKGAPHHHLINVSESGLASHLPASAEKIARHNASHLMRVYPKGTRISSRNLDVVPFWGIGAQICALNWQTFGASMQLNNALFSGTDGFVLKPAALRSGGNGVLNGRKKKLTLHVAGASDIPCPTEKKDDLKPYLTCTLIHPDNLDSDKNVKRKTGAYKQHKLSKLLHKDSPPVTDPLWDEKLEWEYDDNELTFMRLSIKSDDSFATNPTYAIAAVRLVYVQPGWCFIRMLDLKGAETACSLCIKFHFEDL